MSNARNQIVCFGEVLIDFLARPAADAQSPRAFLQFAGGAPANVAVAVARLGGRAQFVGMLGEDMFGDFLHDSLRDCGVGTDYVVRTGAAKTALAFVALDADGERHFNFYRPPAADLLFRAEHYNPACFADMAAFHVCSNSLTEPGIAAATLKGTQLARAAGALVSVDLNWRPSLWADAADSYPRLWSVLRAADLVKLARADVDHLAASLDPVPLHATAAETAVIARIFEGHAQGVIVTDGAAPMRWFTRDAVDELPSFRLQAIDTTAAGDAFVGGLLFELVRQRVDAAALQSFLDTPPFKDAIRFAAAVGGIAVTRHGAFAAMPNIADVQALLAGSTSPANA